MGDISPLDRSPELVNALAELWASGLTRQEICDALEIDVHPDTISRWVKREDVKAAAARVIRDRATRVLRKVDQSIEARLENLDDMDMETLLKVRKEFSGERVEISVERSGGDVVAALWGAADSNPEVAGQLVEGEVIEDD